MRVSSGRPSAPVSEITFALVIAVAIVWAYIIGIFFPRQPILGGDFMQFYTFAAIARGGRWAMQYDWTAFHELQAALVPGSSSYIYAPAYPPLVPALYLPLAFSSFVTAFAVWAATTATVYALLMDKVAASCLALSRRHVLLGSFLFPGFIALIVIGQTTVWPLLGFVTGWLALERARPMLAGVLFSLVAVKPHFGLGLAAVLFFSRSWRTIGGVMAGLALQGTLSLIVCGPDAISAYVSTTLGVASKPGTLEPVDTRHTHTLHAALSMFMPARTAFGIWLVLSVGVGWLASRIWRANTRWTIRISALLLASVLVSPHVLVYDGVLLAPAIFWLLDDSLVSGKRGTGIAALVLVPILVLSVTRVGGVPLTLPLMTWLLWRCRPTQEPLRA